MTNRAISVEHDGYTIDVHHTCGFDNCLVQGLIKLGVPSADAWRLVLRATRKLVVPVDENGDAVITLVDPGECEYDKWCAWCGDFLEHGLNCDCPDTSEERAPLSVGELQKR